MQHTGGNGRCQEEWGGFARIEIEIVLSRAQEFANLAQDTHELLRREPSGLGILLARMISGKKMRQVAGQFEVRSMGKGIHRPGRNQAAAFEQVEIGSMCDSPEDEYCPRP